MFCEFTAEMLVQLFHITVLRTLETVALKSNSKSYEDYKKAVVTDLHQQGLHLYKKLVRTFITYCL